MIDKLLRGHYRIISYLGGGGGGETYIAVDTDRPGHPRCVVKRLKPASNDPSFLPMAKRLFNREAETLEQLGRHDQIPRLLAYFEEEEEFYLVQDFIEGQPLHVELPRGHRWSETKVIRLLDDVLKILEFVHGQGTIHRDIKPANLIRKREDGKIVLIDFGAVKQVRQNPQAQTQLHINPTTISIGTQGYMPSEQVRGKPRPSSDIYALGMIGIQALIGIDPIDLEEDRDGEVVWRPHIQVDDDLATVLTKMVRYHFRDRYESATETLQALKPLIERRFGEQTGIDDREIDRQVKQDGLGTERQAFQQNSKSAELRGTKVVQDDDPAFSADLQPSIEGINLNLADQPSSFEEPNGRKSSQYQQKKLTLVLGVGGIAVLATLVGTAMIFSKQPKSVVEVPKSPENSPTQTPEFKGDYTQLEQYLQQRNWEAADRETYQVMLKLAGPQSTQAGALDLNEWKNFGCAEFQKVDSLWREASGGKLGFGSQLRIFKQTNKVTAAYFEKIGWKNSEGEWKVQWQSNSEKQYEYIPNKKPDFKDPPVGHLPAILPWRNGKDYRLEKSTSCGL